MDNELIRYIKQARSRGLKYTEIRVQLLKAGWSGAYLDKYFFRKHSHDPMPMKTGSRTSKNSVSSFFAAIKGKNFIIAVIVLLIISTGYRGYSYYHEPIGAWTLFIKQPSGLTHAKELNIVYADTTTKESATLRAPANPQSIQPYLYSSIQKEFSEDTHFKQDLIRTAIYGRENLVGTKTFHYQASIRSKLMETVFTNALINYLQAGAYTPSEVDISIIQKLGRTMAEESSIQSLNIWLDHSAQVYKMDMVIGNLPPLFLVESNTNKLPGILASLNNATDAHRLQDIRSLAQALELYYNDNKGYPESLEGIPQNMVPKYIAAIPTAPPETGNCTDRLNKYWYQAQGRGVRSGNGSKVFPKFQLSFCLGSDTSEYKAGIGILDPNGITTSTTCPTHTQDCFLAIPRTVDTHTTDTIIQSLKNGIRYTSSLHINITK